MSRGTTTGRGSGDAVEHVPPVPRIRPADPHRPRLYYCAGGARRRRLFLGRRLWTKTVRRSPFDRAEVYDPERYGPWSARRSSVAHHADVLRASPTAGCWWAAANHARCALVVRSSVGGAAPAVKPRVETAARRPGPCSPATACSPSSRNFPPSLPSKATSPPEGFPGPRAPRHRSR